MGSGARGRQDRQTVKGVNFETNAPVAGQAIAFRTTAKNGVVVTKTFRLFPDTDGLEVELKFESPDKKSGSTAYQLLGPHGIPIEGLWYTEHLSRCVLRAGRAVQDPDACRRRCASRQGKPDRQHRPAASSSPASRTSISRPSSSRCRTPKGQEDRWDSRTVAVVLHKDEKTYQSDVGVQITSRSIKVTPGEPVVHTLPRFRRPQDAPGAQALWRRGARLVSQAAVDSASRPTSPGCDHHANARLHLPAHRAGRPILRRHQGELRNRHHPA